MVNLTLIIVLLIALVNADCGKHRIETIAAHDKFSFEQSQVKYAIDLETYDMVVGSVVELSRGEVAFLYYIGEASCSVWWHVQFDSSMVTDFQTLAIRSESGRVYGTVSS